MTRTVDFPSGITLPALGQGTWHMGDDPARRDDEIAALRAGLDAGLTLVDTAEMYGSGASERLVGDALRGRRDDVFLVSKVLPSHATADGVRAACHASLDRLGTDHLDLYLLHWPGDVPIEETVAGFDRLVADGSIRDWGVSNVDLDGLDALPTAPATDQILYNLLRRGPEFDLLPALADRAIPAMAYSPVDEGRVLAHPEIERVAGELGVTAAVLALAWVIRSGHVLAISKAGSIEHVADNARALDLDLGTDVLAELDRLFPPPTRATPLEII
ncbi:aldo/keto reductase [Rhodococcus sp. HNM0569]|uniref:aldo/keto reductase n=1 Tax=Rhodococcus sp. HNM0569 TaxID=2716340 RepID=UPI00146C261A|nr:aldo/keto reductase [Rhodococcus sp. HNM0569]NLU83846.1 aldo/keto reductase [Rhodococcus sp. HNM0569]